MAMSDLEFARQYAEATQRGEERLQRDPRAVVVSYNRRSRKVVIELDNGCTLLVPPELAQGLSQASPAELKETRILGPGTSIAWPQLDIQFSVTGLLAGVFGTRAWMAELGRAGGRVRSSAKSSAARRNGNKGGCPPGGTVESTGPRKIKKRTTASR